MNESIFVAFDPREDGFIASVPMKQFDAVGERPEAVLEEASATYGSAIEVMQSLLDDFDQLKASRTAITAQRVWEFGDAVFHLVEDLGQSSLEIDGLYEHLVRDLGIERGRLGKYRLTRAITFRRYLPDKDMIPKSLEWSRCEKNARGMAERLVARHREPSVA